jgi:hypothetical protein
VPYKSFLFVLLAVSAFVLVPRRASAQVSHVAVSWSAPADCPSKERVLARVSELAAGDATVRGDATVTREPFGLRLVVRVVTSEGALDRTVSGTSCEALAETAAIILAMSAAHEDASAPLASPPPSGATSAAVTPAISGPPPSAVPHAIRLEPAPTVRDERPASSPLSLPAALKSHVRLSTLGAVDVGTLPSAALGGGLSALAAPTAWSAVGLAAFVWGQRDGTVSGSASQGATFGLFTGDANVCATWSRGPVAVLPCLEIEVAHMTAHGFGAARVSDASATWLGAGAGLRARWDVSRWFGMVAAVDGLVPTSRSPFVIVAAGMVHEPSIVTARLSIGPEVRF